MMHQNCVNKIANSANPDKTAMVKVCTVCVALFVCLSKTLGIFLKLEKEIGPILQTAKIAQ